MSTHDDESAEVLLEAGTIRTRCQTIYNHVAAGESAWFHLNLDKLEPAAEKVIGLTRQTYPDLNVPYHSRWRHFELDGNDLSQQLLLNTDNKLAADIELAVSSVLLDAGAGKQWSYMDTNTGKRFHRSEGLAMASLYGFANGLFSSSKTDLTRADGIGLTSLTVNQLAQCFQVNEQNPLVGLEGRVTLLNRLGQHIIENYGDRARLADLFPSLLKASNSIHANEILRSVLHATGSIWPHSKMIGSVRLADVWQHPRAGGQGVSEGWVPFHKLSQWLSYSLLEPLERQGITVSNLGALTGLPEYRNGGLFIDSGVVKPLNASYSEQRYPVDSEFIVEWRALTVTLLDKIASLIRDKLSCSEQELPLAAVLQGGTWSAGRAFAQEIRQGLPPVDIISDGTVF